MLMRNLTPAGIDLIKAILSIATPLTVAGMGILINRTIQRQNADIQRRSSWMNTWAERFLETSLNFDKAATEFFMVWWLSHTKTINQTPDAIEDEEAIITKCLPYWLECQRGLWEFEKYARFAPSTGARLVAAANVVSSELAEWMRNQGGNVPTFREKQITFNSCVRDVHSELLNIQQPTPITTEVEAIAVEDSSKN
jgi:hypothetical protein